MGLISKQMVFEAIGMCDITQGNKVDGKREEGLWPTPGTLQHFKVGQKKLGRKQTVVSPKSKEENVARREKWSTSPVAAENKTKQKTVGFHILEVMVDLEGSYGCGDNVLIGLC